MNVGLMPCPCCGETLRRALPSWELPQLFDNDAVKLNILQTLIVNDHRCADVEDLVEIAQRQAARLQHNSSPRLGDIIAQMNFGLALAGWTIKPIFYGFQLALLPDLEEGGIG